MTTTEEQQPAEVSTQTSPSSEGAAIALPPAEAPASQESKPVRNKTEKEQALDSLIMQRQEILDKLKAKNPLVLESRKRIAQIIPAVRGHGSSHTMELIRESEHLEFSIATEAYTPKKEKELIKRLREIKTELSKYKELDEARKKVDAERNTLQGILSEIKTLEGELAEVRRKCDEAYAAVLSERKASYEQRQQGRAAHREEKFERLKRTVREEKHRQDDSEMEKYMKDYDDTVSMEEIVVFEKKEKKAKEDAEKGEE